MNAACPQSGPLNTSPNGDTQRERWDERRWSYAGWVATCAEFRRERDKLRRRCPTAKPPSLPILFTGVTDDEAFVDETSRAWFVFLRRWGIEALTTWELPVPMRAEMTEPALYPYENLSEAGMHLFIPWYLLRDKDIRLYELAERNGLSAMPQPLQNWFGD